MNADGRIKVWVSSSHYCGCGTSSRQTGDIHARRLDTEVAHNLAGDARVNFGKRRALSRPTEGLVGCSVSDKASVDAVAQSSLHLRRGLQGAEHVNGGDRFSCELGRYVSRNDSQSEDLDVNRLTNPVRSL